jgi:hypothetical protein
MTVEKWVSDPVAAKEEIRRLQQGNLDKINALAQFGKTVDIAWLANLKIDTFIEMFLDENAKLVYVRNLETKIRVELDNILAQLRQAQLTEGVVAAKSKLFVPGK